MMPAKAKPKGNSKRQDPKPRRERQKEPLRGMKKAVARAKADAKGKTRKQPKRRSPLSPAKEKPKIATVSMAGCFGCHMSLLDIDERILQLIELVDFNKSPIDDIKTFTAHCAIGFIEGGCCNEENVHVLRALPPALRHPDLRRRLRHHGRRAGHAEHAPAGRVPRRGLSQRAHGV